MPTWPITLPETFIRDGYKESPPNNLSRGKTDTGPAMVRKKTSANIRPVQGRLALTHAQVEILDDFYETDLASGALSFDWTHPRTGIAAEFRFLSPPDYSADNDGGFYADCNLEILP